MSLMENWDQGGASHRPEVAQFDMEDELISQLEHAHQIKKEIEREDQEEEEELDPIFSIQRVDYHPPNKIKHMVVCNRTVVMALEDMVLIRIKAGQVDERGKEGQRDLEEITDIQRKYPHGSPKVQVHKMFMDPTGVHLIVSLTNLENWYLHRDQLRPKVLDKFKGISIDSIAWDKTNEDPTTTSKILIGTHNGRIREALIGRGGKDVHIQNVYNMHPNSPITGLHYERFPAEKEPKYVVFATTTTRIYEFIGGPTFEAVFPNYETNPRFVELPGELNYSKLCFFSKFCGGLSQSFAWLTGPGVYYGDLIFGGQNPGDSLFEETTLLPFPQLSRRDEEHDITEIEPPLDMVVTEFHFLLLYRNKLVSISRLDEQVTSQETIATLARKVGNIVGMTMDPVTKKAWIYAQGSVYMVNVHSESRNVWKLYLDKFQFEEALKYCQTKSQKDLVISAQADYYFKRGNYQLAASEYGKTQKSFEEVTLKFVRKNEMIALMTYLRQKIDNTNEKDVTQRTLICTWLVQLFLNSLSSITNKEKKEAALYEFKQFLVDYRAHLDPKTTIGLLTSYGLVDPLLHYAKLSGAHDLLVQQLIELQTRRKPSKNINPYRRYEEDTFFYRHAVDTMLDVYKTLDINSEASRLRYENLVYKFSSLLIEKVPCELVTVWTKSSILQPRKLLPALANYDISANAPDNNTHQGIRYLEHCIYSLDYHDQTLHNALLSYYAKDEESILIKFIDRENRCFDLQYALRQCMREKKTRSCVLIYRQMGLLEEATELALGIDEKLARETAKMADDDDALSKRLWLRIARHVVEEKGEMEKAMDFLKECPLLKIEDILPFFKDFVTIDEFQDEICSALTGYNEHIDELKHEMILTESSSELIRKDIRKLKQQCGFVTETHECDLCGQQLLGQPFYLFPCEHAFHTDCFSRAVRKHMDRVTLGRLENLERQLKNERRKIASKKSSQRKSQGKEEESTFTFLSKVLDTIESNTDILKTQEEEREEEAEVSGKLVSDLIQEEIDRIVAKECLFCGDDMINSVGRPFIDYDFEKEEVLAWALF